MAPFSSHRPQKSARLALNVGAVALLLALALAGCKSKFARLPALEADAAATSVSGLSSGAYMAGQFHIAHSRNVVGAGIIAGGPFGCAQSIFAEQMPGPGTAFLNLSRAVNGCMLDAMRNWGVPNVALLAERARKLAREDRIDPLEALTASRVYLFSGTEDHTVLPSIVHATAELYEALGVAKDRLALITEVPAGHAFVTPGKGIACGRTAKPYITACGYDQAGDLLAHIYGGLKPRAPQTTGEFLTFEQREFVRDLSGHGLADAGMLYVPAACRAAPGCRVHIVFHGCNQHLSGVGEAFVRDSGFANWAEHNHLLVLFPQATASPINPQACWDWWGYTGRDYLTRAGPQILAVRRMLDRLASKAARVGI